ncbi:MAG: Fur family transcriptional regulator [Candidatus Anammoxibacter sp.]
MITKLKRVQGKTARVVNKKKRITPQLMEVRRIVNSRDNHFSVSDIYNEVRKTLPSISLNTVYCILKKINCMGEIQEVVTLGKETNYCPSAKIHHHVVCNKCRKIKDIEADFFDINNINNTVKSEYKIESYSIVFNGYCNTCNNNKAQYIVND